jgi:hypothetical protein
MNRSLTVLTLSLAAMTAGIAWAKDVDLSKLPPVGQQKGVTYTKDVRPILQASCFGCHGEKRQKGGLRLDSLEAALKGGEDGPVIKPGKSVNSQLVIAVARLDEESAMPPQMKPGRGPGGGGPGGGGGNPPGPGGPGGFGPPPKPLTTEQVSLIRAWIDQGAK